MIDCVVWKDKVNHMSSLDVYLVSLHCGVMTSHHEEDVDLLFRSTIKDVVR